MQLIKWWLAPVSWGTRRWEHELWCRSGGIQVANSGSFSCIFCRMYTTFALKSFFKSNISCSPWTTSLRPKRAGPAGALQTPAGDVVFGWSLQHARDLLFPLFTEAMWDWALLILTLGCFLNALTTLHPVLAGFIHLADMSVPKPDLACLQQQGGHLLLTGAKAAGKDCVQGA